jgi:hypothetical protein
MDDVWLWAVWRIIPSLLSAFPVLLTIPGTLRRRHVTSNLSPTASQPSMLLSAVSAIMGMCNFLGFASCRSAGV